MRPIRLTLTLLATVCSVVALAACGSSNNSGAPSGGSGTSSAGPTLTGLANTGLSSSPHHGGTLHVVSAEGWLSLDPGKSYFQIDYLVVYATQTPLYMFNPV